MRTSQLLAATVAMALGGTMATANANPVTWTTWSPSFTLGTPGGSALGDLAGNAVTYSGELQSLSFTVPSYAPSSSFSGNGLDNAPLTAQGTLGLFGGGRVPAADTINFATAVTNP